VRREPEITYRLKVFQKEGLRKILVRNKDELTGRMERIMYREISCCTPLTKYYAYQPVAEDEMGCACGMYGEDDEWMQGYGGEVWRGIPDGRG
jgi:hypothetical protein